MTSPSGNDPKTPKEDGPSNFIAELVQADIQAGKHGGRVRTRFPPEPNGYLHIGHAKSICLNFGTAALSPNGLCNLRFDDTNPTKEDIEYVDSIRADVRWLGFDWKDREFFASDYFDQLYEWARQLIKDGNAYVDSRGIEEVRESRGNFYKKGINSPYRDRSVEENLDLFRRMRDGEFDEGSHVLRAKIDMESPNLNLRDPPIYRILKSPHHRTGSKWNIYPMYDYAHGLSDAIEGITHSICTLEFENHRPLYDWFLDQLPVPFRPRQIEFARLNLSYTIMSKRLLLQLVTENRVDGWDDPRMPTISGMRRRGYTAAAIRKFCDRIGVAKRDGLVDVSLLEFILREDLNAACSRYMAVLKPLRVVIENFPEGQVHEVEAINHPEYPQRGGRKLALTRELFIERDDFLENPPNKKWFRLAPGAEVRLRYACLITCKEVVKDAAGNVVQLNCTWDPDSLGGVAPDNRRVKGTLHWVSAERNRRATVRLYDRLFKSEDPRQAMEDGQSLEQLINPDSCEVLTNCALEEALATLGPEAPVQFERLGYFCADSRDSRPDRLVFNRTISLRDTWAKIAGKG